MLRDRYRVIVQTGWKGERADAMIALHARRSAASIAAFHEHSGSAHLAVVLTGTDLYRDLPESAEAAHSLDVARRIVVLQDDGLRFLTPGWRRKAEAIFQSAAPVASRKRPRDRLACVVVGHLREEKDPRTLFRAIERLPADLAIRVDHIGTALELELGREAEDLAARDARYRYLGALPAGRTRAAIAAAHVLIHPSIAEGGANAIAEAVVSGTGVIASRISGNVGMLGRDHPGYFEAGDESGLARRLVQACGDREFRRALLQASARRKALFSGAKEARAVRALAASLLDSPGR
jgi:putative glycosyltransferase (TIGR04348 family)